MLAWRYRFCLVRLPHRVLRSWYWRPVWLEFKGKDFPSDVDDLRPRRLVCGLCTHMIDQPGWPKHQQVVLAFMPVRSASPSSAVIT